MTISASTFSNNTCVGYYGGALAALGAPTFYTVDNNFTVENSVFVGNSVRVVRARPRCPEALTSLAESWSSAMLGSRCRDHRQQVIGKSTSPVWCRAGVQAAAIPCIGDPSLCVDQRYSATAGALAFLAPLNLVIMGTTFAANSVTPPQPNFNGGAVGFQGPTDPTTFQFLPNSTLTVLDSRCVGCAMAASRTSSTQFHGPNFAD